MGYKDNFPVFEKWRMNKVVRYRFTGLPVQRGKRIITEDIFAFIINRARERNPSSLATG